MKLISSVSSVVVAAAVVGSAIAQRPPRGGAGGGITCPDQGGFEGATQYLGSGAKAAPLRGAIGCVDSPLEVTNGRGETSIGTLIYGPMEAGFSNDQLSRFFGCSNSNAAIPGGLDTLLAERIVEYECDLEDDEADILDSCGGHANPYHYHERMTCLYHSDEASGHSTRVGTALDGNGIYGKYINGGVVPTDLDACGGRTGITPDSNGKEVYYYVIQDRAPFTVGCFGPVASVQECRDLYSTCGDGDAYEITTKEGTITYDPDCPCYDAEGSNVGFATAAPETEAPATEAPETEAPETEAPETEAPETEAPETDAPATDAPATEAPATEAPTTEAPATDSPATSTPTGRPTKKKGNDRKGGHHDGDADHDDDDDGDHDGHKDSKTRKTIIYGCAGAAGAGLLAAVAVYGLNKRKAKANLAKTSLKDAYKQETVYVDSIPAKDIANGKEVPTYTV